MASSYASLKKTDIVEIGNIPSDWSLIKLKFISDIFGRIGFRGYTASDLVDEGEGAITLGPPNIENQKLNLTNKKYLSWEKYDESPEIKIYNGDLLLVKTASVGKVALVEHLNEPTTINPQLTVFKNIQINKKYFYYTMVSKVIQHQIALNVNGGVISTLSQENIQNYIIPLPSHNEQKQIANYLDKKTDKIDTIIAKNEELIELLEEKRVVLINEVVTKGLNPDVAMKDSGVEWIGEIPEHWEVVPFKRLFNNIKDGTHGSFQRVSDGKPLLSAKNVFNNTINISENESLISEEDYHSIVSNGFPKLHDLLITIVGTIGRSCVYDRDYPLAFQRSVSFIRLTHDNPYFYNYFVKSDLFYSQLMINAKESAQKGVYLNDIKECLVIKPPIETQIEIADYLEKHTSKINNTISKIQENIELLEEYKTSLIHHVVTGKIDVRGEEI